MPLRPVAASVAALNEKFSSLGVMIQTPDGRSLLCAALCICCAQTFIDGSAKALGFAPAFKATLDDYVGSSTEAAVVAEIRQITDSTSPAASPQLPQHKNMSTWFPQPAWIKKRKERKEREAREERQKQAVIDIIKTHRLRFHEEGKAQTERANRL
ncbi:hypothetical protein C8R45DRAFT_1111527 [Mycena sanguinolenta]|nr:hypothetical protein C8R45DRAFT_1111527 [Mycena sanguinolenta]